MGIPVLQPAKLKNPDILSALQELNPEVIVVAAYGKILPAGVLALPPHGCLNLHPSLLPKYRGPAPIQWAILRGEKKTGVSIIQLTEKMDAGPILLQKEVDILEDETAGELSMRLSHVGAELMVDAVKAIEQGKAVYGAQNEEEASLAPFIKKEDGEIAWTLSAVEIRDKIRGLLPWPGAFTFLLGKRIKILKGRAEESRVSAAPPGTITEVSRDGFRIATGKGDLVILEIQMEGKTRMSAGEFLLGHKVSEGICLLYTSDAADE